MQARSLRCLFCKRSRPMSNRKASAKPRCGRNGMRFALGAQRPCGSSAGFQASFIKQKPAAVTLNSRGTMRGHQLNKKHFAYLQRGGALLTFAFVMTVCAGLCAVAHAASELKV